MNTNPNPKKDVRVLKDIELNKFYNELVSDLKQGECVKNPEQEATWILKTLLNFTEADIHSDKKVDIEVNKAVFCLNLVARRSTGEPLAYIIGFVPFYDLNILTQAPTLIPRPETEEWTSNLCKSLKKKNADKIENFSILDLCSGSGCISLALAHNFKNSKVSGADISPEALSLSKINQKNLKIENCKFIKSNLFKKVTEKVDLIVSNPPYVSLEEYEALDPQVKNWENPRALLADNDGLEFYEKIASQAKTYLTDRLSKAGHPNLVLEIGYNQAEQVSKILEQHGFKNIKVEKDMAEKDRVITCFSE